MRGPVALALTPESEILSLMAKYSGQLDRVFAALADPTRRGIVRHLGSGPASVSELARDTSLALPSFMKHVHALETSGLVETSKTGRVRTCVLNEPCFSLIEDWLFEQRTIWSERTDRLEDFLADPKEHQ